MNKKLLFAIAAPFIISVSNCYSFVPPTKADLHTTQFVRNALRDGLTQGEINRVRIKHGEKFAYRPNELIVPITTKQLETATPTEKHELQAAIKLEHARMQQGSAHKDFGGLVGSGAASTVGLWQLHRNGKNVGPFKAMRGHGYKALFGVIYFIGWQIITIELFGAYMKSADKKTFAHILAHTRNPDVLRTFAEQYKDSKNAHEQEFARACLIKAGQQEAKRIENKA